MEAALVLPVLLMLVFGIIDFGRMLNAQIKLTEAAREGARASSLNGDIDLRVEAVMGDMSNVQIDPGKPCPSDPDAVVTVSYDFHFVTPFAALANFAGGSFKLTGKGVMPCRA